MQDFRPDMSMALKKGKETILPIDAFQTRGDRIFHIVNYTLIASVVLIVLLPLINVLASSFSSAHAINSGRVYLWPVDFEFTGYEKVFQYPHVWRSYCNTIFYTVAGTAINIIMTLIAAYPLSRRNLPFRGFFMFLFIFTMLFNGGMIPTYLVMRQIDITDKVWSILLPGAVSVYYMIIARTFMHSISEELYEAANIDGCSDFRYFFSIILPLSTTMISVLTLYYAVGHWNAYFNAFLYLINRDLMPLQIILREVLLSVEINAESISDAESMQALAGMSDLLRYSLIVVSSAPILCLYPFLQKYFVKGIMIGSLKG